MADPFVMLRHQLLAGHPGLAKYMPKKKTDRLANVVPSKLALRPPSRQRTRLNTYKPVDPKSVNGETDIFESNGKMYKRVTYGTKQDFLYHRALNSRPPYTTTLCPGVLDDLKNRKDLTIAGQEAKVNETLKQRNLQAEESEKRKDSMKCKTGTFVEVDDLIKQDRARISLTLKKASNALIDKQEVMRDFYSVVGSKQVLAMRELQIDAAKHLKGAADAGTSEAMTKEDLDEYQEMLKQKAYLKEKNNKIVNVLKKQALEKEILRSMETQQNLENAEKLDALAEAELMKRMLARDGEEQERVEHFRTVNAIAEYKNYLRQVNAAEDEFLHKRETDFLVRKNAQVQKYNDKMDAIKADKQKRSDFVSANLGSKFHQQEQEEMEYYYTLQKERDIQAEDREAQDKLNKKLEMENLLKEWGKIKEENDLLRQKAQNDEMAERDRMKAFMELENATKKAEDKKRQVDKDINRMEIMFQMNDRERQRQEDAEAKRREVELLRAEGFVHQGKIKDRMIEKVAEFKRNGLPERFLSNVVKQYNL